MSATLNWGKAENVLKLSDHMNYSQHKLGGNMKEGSVYQWIPEVGYYSVQEITFSSGRAKKRENWKYILNRGPLLLFQDSQNH